MKIKINNIFKNKQKSKNDLFVRKAYKEEIKFNENNSKIINKDLYIVQKPNIELKKKESKPIFKVYKNGGEIIKYDLNILQKDKNKENTKEEYVRTGAKLLNDNLEIDAERKFERIKRNRPQRIKSKIPKNSFLVFFLMIILAGASLTFAYKNYNLSSEESYAVYSSIEDSQEEKESKIEEQNSNSNNNDTKQKEESINNEKINTNTKKTTASTSNSIENKQVQKVVPLNFAKPISGEILKIYSKDKVIYSKTLELWKTHDGIDIKADENTIVKSIEKGTVEKVYEDSFYGKTIVIDHGQGYKSSYSNLDNEVFVKEKQVIAKLTKIGKIGKTAIGEIKDEPHLHFTLIKNNEISDPTSIFR